MEWNKVNIIIVVIINTPIVLWDSRSPKENIFTDGLIIFVCIEM